MIWRVMKEIGLVGLLCSRKGTAFLLTLAASTVGLLEGKLQGTAFAAIIATIFSIFTVTHTYQQINGNSDTHSAPVPAPSLPTPPPGPQSQGPSAP